MSSFNKWTPDRSSKSEIRGEVGVPPAPLLFICVMEFLVELIQNDDNVVGVQILGGSGRQAKCSMYMDDINVVCRDQ